MMDQQKQYVNSSASDEPFLRHFHPATARIVREGTEDPKNVRPHDLNTMWMETTLESNISSFNILRGDVNEEEDAASVIKS